MTTVFPRCETGATGGPGVDLAPFMLFRHVIEMTDSVEILLSQACVTPCVLPLRSSFAAGLGLEYLVRDDYERRSLSWLCVQLHKRIQRARLYSGDTEGLSDELREAMGAEHAERAREEAKSFEALLNEEPLAEIEEEYQRLKRVRNRAPTWFSLYGGPDNRLELARDLGHEDEYHTLYRVWSELAHGQESGPYIDQEHAALNPLRYSPQLPRAASLAASFMLRSMDLMLSKFRPGEDRASWYKREVRDAYIQLTSMRVQVISEVLHGW